MHAEPFVCYRPAPESAAKFAALPYDVFDREGAAAYVREHPRSFLAIDRPETGFSPDHDMYADDVYAHASELLRERVADGTLVRDGRACYYLYRLEQDGREQTGIVAACSLDDYNNGVIRRHESTRRAKEEDRVRHIRATGCQTGPIFLAYRDNPALEALVEAAKGAEPLYDFTDGEGVRQTVWRVARPAAVEAFQMMLAYIPRAYIADGTTTAPPRPPASARRCAPRRDASTPAARPTTTCCAFSSRQASSPCCPTSAWWRTPPAWARTSSWRPWQRRAEVGPRREEPVEPGERGTFGMYAFGAWRELRFVDGDAVAGDPVARLDASVLQDRVLGPVLGIGDPREDPRVSFVGGAVGLGELERRAGRKGVAFALHATSVDELMAVADAGLLMPPKSTWFEPKLRSGLFISRIANKNTVIDGVGRPAPRDSVGSARKGPFSGLGRLVSALAGRGRAAGEKDAEAGNAQQVASATADAGRRAVARASATAVPAEADAAPSESALDMAALVKRLLRSREPLGQLRSFVTDVEGRAAGDASRQDALLPCGRERHLARAPARGGAL